MRGSAILPRRRADDLDRVRVLPAGDAVVVETEATYVDGEDVSRVASCDVYDFAGDRLSAISSYNVEPP